MLKHVIFLLLTIVLPLQTFALPLQVSKVSTPVQLYYPSLNTVAGNPKGNITIVEFFDYYCSTCKQIPDLLETLVAAHPEVRVVYRDAPILSNQSVFPAQIALSASLYNRYNATHNAFMNYSSLLDQSAIIQLAQSVGLNQQQLDQAAKAPAVQQQLRQNAAYIKSLDIVGVPTFFIAKTPKATFDGTVLAYKLASADPKDLKDIVEKLVSE